MLELPECNFFMFYWIYWDFLEGDNRKPERYRAKLRGQHQRTKLFLITKFTEKKVCPEQNTTNKTNKSEKKHIMCNASYLYSHIEICHNSLISFFLPLNKCYNKINEKRTSMLESIQSIIPSWQMSKINCIFFFIHLFYLFWRNTSANKMCCNSPKRKKIFQKVNIDTEV